MAIKKFKIEASEQAKQLAKKPVKASDGEWDKAVISFIDTIPELPEQGKVISKKYKGFPVVIVGLGDGKCLYNGYTRTNDAASDVQFIRGLIKRGDSPEKATANLGFKTYIRGEVEGACGGKKKSVKSATRKPFKAHTIKAGAEIIRENDTEIVLRDDDGAQLRVVKRPYGYRIRRSMNESENGEFCWDISKEVYDTPEEAKQAALDGTATFTFKGRKYASPIGESCSKESVKSAAGKKRWGLYSDFGQRILNETFDSKREAQKAFREYGYTKDSEAWIEEVDETAVGKFDKKPANSACGGKKTVKSSAKKSVKCAADNADLERAKQLIVDIYNRDRKKGDEITVEEFDADEDLNKVSILYTDIGDDNEYSFQIFVDLINPKIIVELDGDIIYEYEYSSVGALADELEDYDWDDMYYQYLQFVPDEIVYGKDVNGACGGKKSVKSSAKKSVKCAADNADLERAKQNIVDGYNNDNWEYGEKTVEEYFKDEDLNRVPILYTTLGDENEHDYQLYADLVNPKIIVEIDGETIYEDKFPNIGALADDLEDFEWDNWYSYYLRYVPDEIVYGDSVESACGGKKSVKGGRDKLKARKDWAVDVASRYSLFNGKNGDIENSNNKAELIRKCKAMSDPAWVEDNMLSGIIYNNDAQSDVDNADNPNYRPKKKSIKSSKRSRSVKAASADGYDFAFYRDGYRVLTKTENNRGKWLAQKDNEEPFEITYEQARGFEPIDPRNRALQLKVGKALKFPIKSAAEDSSLELNQVYKALGEMQGTWKNPETGWTGKCEIYQRDLEDGSYVFSLVFGNNTSEPDDILYVPSKHKFTIYPNSGMPRFANSLDEFKRNLKAEYSYLTKVGDDVKSSIRRPAKKTGIKAAKKDNMNKEAHKWYNISLTKDEYAKFRKFLKENGYKYEPSEEGQNTYVKVYLTKADADKVNKFLDSMDDVESACGGKKSKKIVKASAAAKRRAKKSVKASKYYEITDHYNDEVGRADTEDEARELAKKLVRENDVDYYDIFWVDTDPDSTDDTSYIDTVYADKPFSVKGYYDGNFRGLSDSDTFYELRDALEYAQELLSRGNFVKMECENAGGRLEITPDEYEEFMMTDPEYFEDLPKLAEWISDVQVERMDSRQEPWLDNWQYNTDIGMSTNAVKADLSSLEEIEEWGTDIPDKTKELGAFNSDTAPYDVNTTVAEYITDNYGIYAESVSYVEYNGPGDWVVDMSQSGQAVADDFVYFLSEKDYDLSLKLYGESETDASGYDMAKYYGDSAIHGNDFQFQFYPAQNQWSAPQVDVDVNELIQIGLTQEEANRVVDLVAEYEQNYISICQDINYYIESFLKELSEEEVKASTGVKAALGNKNKTDYASNPIYELDKYVKDLAEGVAAAAGITLTYQVSDEAITFIDGDGTAVFIQPIDEITPEPDDLENDIQELVSAIQYEDMDNPEYWPTDTSEDDPDYATRAVQMSVDDDLEPVMGEGEDIGFGVDSYGETIDESTVSELYRIAEKEILPNTELAQIDPYVSIDEDSWDFYFGGVSNAGMMGVVKFYIHFKLTSDNINLNEYVLPDAKLYPDFNYYKASLDFDIYTENGKVTDVVLESADIYKSDNSYDDHFSGKFGEAFNTEALENYIEKLAAPAAEEIYNAVSNL